MHNRSLSRELSLISLGLIKDKGDFKLNKFQIEEIFESALDSLINHCREELDNCESELENASQKILDSELQEGVDSSYSNVRDELKKSLTKIETVMNTLSITLDFPKLIVSSGQIDIREDVNQRICNIFRMVLANFWRFREQRNDGTEPVTKSCGTRQTHPEPTKISIFEK